MSTNPGYHPESIEKKWQDRWEEKEVFHVKESDDRPKFYALIEFPYPSGQGLHVGHPRPYTALDVVARKRRMQGYNVLFPMGWDAFGLPTENYAIKNKIHPEKVTKQNVARFKAQLQSLGFSFDWSREINTTDPSYYKWTQWIFLKLFEKDLAYKQEIPINWCTSCKIGLSNEEVVQGSCERCGGEVVQKVKNQWMLKITEYAERLIKDLDEVDYIERVKTQQKNWIGKSEGMEIKFPIDGTEESLGVFTTRPDTLFGATYMVISPEHPLLNKLQNQIKNFDEVHQYQHEAAKKSDFERSELIKEKTGVELKGIKAINPASKEEMTVWISDYVLMTYGTGAIMAVPGHDSRDWEFARKFNLPIKEVVKGGDITKEAFTDVDQGILINSDFINGLKPQEAIERISDWLAEQKLGEKKVNYKLRDWVFSRQRYWGEPIPLVYCKDCGWVPVPEKELPLELPKVENYEPTDDGESPLANIEEWVKTPCPSCGKEGRRETDTMPQWAGSSWYYLRYMDPNNDEALASKERLDYWLPVDWYNGGMEHTTLHLLYSRFWHKFLYDVNVVPTKEPYYKRTSHGMILGENNEKMSKSKGNVINPDEIIEEFGADTLRVYEMFIGDFEKSVPWSQNGVKGCRRFLDRVWKVQDLLVEGEDFSNELEVKMHQTIKKVSDDYESLKYNTGIAALMTLINEFYDLGRVTKGEFKTFLLLLNPVAPHITEELWEILGHREGIVEQHWPIWNEDKTVDKFIEIAVQVNGKVRGKVKIQPEADKESVEKIVKEAEGIKEYLENREIVKEIYVPGRIYNIVVKG
ncbi:leucine--tRNA ligase [Isachenkonia alkalipeptolytica]|uniref:Leucine--tRNA ligase n=1 Tax=Isachenkonia alkalipeptolytica TaxID=2565777 RepID=A0AA43XMT2_9CLOT|nr:leucine--tRNA ligase [Isachenkonia alkalipeptolytica]NBG89605.1 leucine--tRNA ligase [Isachenkonia alkalipeptolytica]